jgi:SAM-dependent methyltransferase
MSLRTTFFALTYDRQMAGTEKAGLRAFRDRLLAGAAGDVLEIGAGTGANLPCYGPAVGSLTITEPQPPMLRRLERAARTHRPDTLVLRAPAEDLPFDDHSFDVAVSTLVLCGVDDQPRALRELRRVLRPGGRLLLIEHLRSEDPALARLQGPDELAQPAGRLLRLQPPHARRRPAGRLHRRSTAAHGPAQGPEVRGPGHPGQRHRPRGHPVRLHPTCSCRG